eukprot:scaffold166951_cov27-Tisochrysis_lutea.AAC.5
MAGRLSRGCSSIRHLSSHCAQPRLGPSTWPKPRSSDGKRLFPCGFAGASVRRPSGCAPVAHPCRGGRDGAMWHGARRTGKEGLPRSGRASRAAAAAPQAPAQGRGGTSSRPPPGPARERARLAPHSRAPA